MTPQFCRSFITLASMSYYCTNTNITLNCCACKWNIVEIWYTVILEVPPSNQPIVCHFRLCAESPHSRARMAYMLVQQVLNPGLWLLRPTSYKNAVWQNDLALHSTGVAFLLCSNPSLETGKSHVPFHGIYTNYVYASRSFNLKILHYGKYLLTWKYFIKELYFFLEISVWVLLVGRLHKVFTWIEEALKNKSLIGSSFQ